MQSRPTVWIQAVVTFSRTSSPSTDRWSSCASHRPRTTRSRASAGRAITISELH